MARKEVDETVLSEMNDEAQGSANAEAGSMEVMSTSSMELGAVQGEVSADDIRLPRLQIAYGVGGLSENFAPGDLVLGGEERLVGKGEPLNLIILNVRQYWKERLDSAAYAAGISPRQFETEAEVVADGGTTRWVGQVGPNFGKALTLRMLIEKPEGLVCGLFGIPIGDKEYAPAVWDVDKSAYKRIGPVVLSSAQFSLRKRGLLSGTFTVFTRSEKINGNNTVVPVIKLSAHNTDEQIADIKMAFGQ
jgi:hypothetical protein